MKLTRDELVTVEVLIRDRLDSAGRSELQDLCALLDKVLRREPGTSLEEETNTREGALYYARMGEEV